MTPEVYLMQCDQCPSYVPGKDVLSQSVRSKRRACHFATRKVARDNAVLRGWYIGDEELCPRCAEKRGKHGDT